MYCAVLCCAVLCCAVLCCAVLCYAMLWLWLLWCFSFNFTYYGEQQNSGVRTQNDVSKRKHVGTTVLFRGSGDHRVCAQRCRDLLQYAISPLIFSASLHHPSSHVCSVSVSVSLCVSLCSKDMEVMLWRKEDIYMSRVNIDWAVLCCAVVWCGVV